MKIQWSGTGITEGRGKTGNKIASRNIYGNYEKAYAIPTDPNTVPQQNIRTGFGNLMSLWNLLGDDIRAEWISYASNRKHNGRMSIDYSYSGVQLFMKINMNILMAGFVPIVVPPIDASPIPLKNLSCTIDFTDGVTFTGMLADGTQSTPNDCAIVIFGSPAHNSGRMKVTNGYRGLARLNTGEWFDPLPDWGFYTDVFPLPAPGQKIFFRMVVINYLSGQRSPLMWCSGIVQP